MLLMLAFVLQESLYAMQPMSGRYAAAPWLYLLSDMPHESLVRKIKYIRASK